MSVSSAKTPRQVTAPSPIIVPFTTKLKKSNANLTQKKRLIIVQCEDKNDWWSNLVFNSAVDMPYNTFKSIGDVVQECAETYKQASMYLEGTGDEIQLAKTMAGLAEMYLEYCFSPVVFFELGLSDS